MPARALIACLWLVALFAPAFGANAEAPERRVALVIGNGAYQNVPQLENPANDARAMADKLASLGFNVIGGYDLTKAQTQTAIAKFAEAVRGADIGLFYYAGHGMQVSGSNYLVPVDAALKDEISLDFETVPIDFVWRQMSRSTKVRIVLLDACRDNPLAKRFAASGGQPSGGLAEMQIESAGSGGALIAFATSPGQVAYDGADGHSPFTSSLIAHLGDPNSSLTSVMTRVTGDVFKATDGHQRPWVNVSLTDDVMLNRTAVAAPAATPGAPSQADLAALEQERRLIPTIETKGPIRFDMPINFGEPALDGKSIAQLIEGKPIYSPIDGLDKAEWDHPCATCHNWTRERLCTQSGRYDREDISVLRLQHPYGARFKVALANWARNGCK
jgi:uncharacterized caspase-like protein